MADIYSYGSINVDHIYQVPHLVAPGETLASTAYTRVLGGKGANQSIALARAGASVRHIGRFGAGDEWVLEPLQQAGVDCSSVSAIDGPSGHAIIQVDSQAENNIILFSGANHSFVSDELELLLANANSTDWLLLQNECSCTEQMIRAAVAKGMQVAYNPSPMTPETTSLPLELLSLLVVNEVEVGQLLDVSSEDRQAIIAAIRERLPSTKVVVTFGAQGAMWVDAEQVFEVPAQKVEALDTTAAGDTFLGFLLAGLCQDMAPRQAVELGSRASAIAVQRLGASVSIPSLDELSVDS